MTDGNEKVIEFKNAAIFQLQNQVLSDVNFCINKGEFVYLIGVTGSGKSSLLRTIYADIPLQKGYAKIAGYNLTELKSTEIPFLRRKLGIVFQDFQLLTDRPVNDNLVFVLKATGWSDKKKMKERMERVLTRVGLEDKGGKMPHQLSGGEQQRIAIARALLNDPEIMLADEPTGNLDPNTSNEILELLKEISEAGRAVFMATHDYSLFKKFPSRTLQCENSRLSPIEYKAD
ncbi:MAG: ATP-binding cassette domain-containing protein [Bacteroidales bacterium]|nr:ATP-binding cassette domain-containing protein [Bacteroidales bacterium]